MTAPWLFAQWGLDIIGSFPIAVRQPPLRKGTCEASFGDSSYAGSGSLESKSQTTGNNSTTTSSWIFARS